MSFVKVTWNSGDTGTSTKLQQMQDNTVACAQNKFKNLQVFNTSTARDNKMSITIASIATQHYIFSGVTVYADMSLTGSGANADDGIGGLDTGSEAANTWYYIHLIYNPTLNRIKGMLSTSRTSPTLPSGYTEWTRVGAVKNNNSSNFYYIRQFNNKVIFNASWFKDIPSNGTVLFAGGAATTATTVTGINSIVPESVVLVTFVARMIGNSGIGILAYMVPTGDIVPIDNANTVAAGIGSGVLYFAVFSIFDFFLGTNQQVDYFVSGTGAQLTLSIAGYYDPLS